MINLMYLVLTAMLALNITKEVLDAFSTINTSIETSNEGIGDKNKRMYTAFQHIADKRPELKAKADSLYRIAEVIRTESQSMDDKLAKWKDQIVTTAGGWVTESGVKRIKLMDDIDMATRIFVEEKNGDLVKKQLEDYINTMVAKVPQDQQADLRKSLPLKINAIEKSDLNPGGDWSFGTFHNIPVIAAVTLFSKWQSDVKNSESVMIEHLMAQVGDEAFDSTIYKIDGLMAVAVPSTNYALAGDEITANIALASYSKSANPIVTSNVGGATVKDGVGVIKFRANGTGVQTVRGTISLTVKGKTETQPWSFNYTVGTAGASLQLDKMNVMYIGLDNPVTLSASGYNIEDVSWDMPGATITKVGAGKFTVKVTTPNNKGVDYTISARNKAGQVVKVGGGQMRIRTVPNPVVKFAGKTGSITIPVNQAKAQLGLIAELENFIYDYRFLVHSFRMVRIAKGSEEEQVADVVGASFSGAAKNLIAASKAGDTWYFEGIKVVGPGVPPRNVDGAIIVKLR